MDSPDAEAEGVDCDVMARQHASAVMRKTTTRELNLSVLLSKEVSYEGTALISPWFAGQTSKPVFRGGGPRLCIIFSE